MCFRKGFKVKLEAFFIQNKTQKTAIPNKPSHIKKVKPMNSQKAESQIPLYIIQNVKLQLLKKLLKQKGYSSNIHRQSMLIRYCFSIVYRVEIGEFTTEIQANNRHKQRVELFTVDTNKVFNWLMCIIEKEDTKFKCFLTYSRRNPVK